MTDIEDDLIANEEWILSDFEDQDSWDEWADEYAEYHRPVDTDFDDPEYFDE